MGFVSRWFSRTGGSARQQEVSVAEAVQPALVQPVVGRVVKGASASSARSDAERLVTLMFGRRLRRAPSGWLLAPCAGIVTADLAGRRLAGSEYDFCVSFSPGWGLGVLPELSSRFFVVEAKALVTGPWSGALAPGGEHLFDEILALVDMAKELRMIPVFLDNADLAVARPESFTSMSQLEMLRKAVPAVVDAETVSAGAEVSPSSVLQELFDYWREGL